MSATKNTVLPLPDISPRDAYDKANHYDSTFKHGRKYFEYNYWGKIYQHLHPSHTQAGTEHRTRCMNVLKRRWIFTSIQRSTAMSAPR